jgi:uncharacterized protein (DUF302 family)
MRPVPLLRACRYGQRIFDLRQRQGGTALMQALQTIGIDLPLKALVWQDALGTTWLPYNDPAWLAHRHGPDEEARALVGSMTAALNALATKATTPPEHQLLA